MNDATAARKRRRRTNRRYGDLVKVAARLSGRSPKTIYAVLKGTIKSAHVLRAIEEADRQLRSVRPVRGKVA
jgi:hypothetical protein